MPDGTADTRHGSAGASTAASHNHGKRGRGAAPRRVRLRHVLLIGAPILVGLAALVAYGLGGRYVETDDAYVKADKVGISAQVAGPITEVEVAEKTDQGGENAARFRAVERIDDRVTACSDIFCHGKQRINQSLPKLTFRITGGPSWF